MMIDTTITTSHSTSYLILTRFFVKISIIMARVKFAEGTKPGAKQSRTKSSTKSGRKSKSNINRYFEKSGRTKIPPEPTKRSEKSGPKTVSPGSPFVEKRGLGKSRRGGGLKGSNLDFDDEQREEQPGTPKLCLCVDFRTDSGAGGGDFGGLSGGFSGSSTEQDSQSAAFRLLMGEVLESGVKRGVLGKGNFIVGARGMEESSEFLDGDWGGESLKSFPQPAGAFSAESSFSYFSSLVTKATTSLLRARIVSSRAAGGRGGRSSR